MKAYRVHTTYRSTWIEEFEPDKITAACYYVRGIKSNRQTKNATVFTDKVEAIQFAKDRLNREASRLRQELDHTLAQLRDVNNFK